MLRSGVAGYLALLVADPHGSFSLLYPYDVSELARVRAGEEVLVPAPDPSQWLTVEPPFGRNVLIALAYPRVPDDLLAILRRPDPALTLDGDELRALLHASPAAAAYAVATLTVEPR